MGEVYLAEDAELKRKVALMFLSHSQNTNNDPAKPPLMKAIKIIVHERVTNIPAKAIIHTGCVMATLLMLIMTMACSDETLDSTDLSDLSGVWELTTTITSNTCNMNDGSSNKDWIILIQCDKEVSVIRGAGLWGSGAIQGDRLDFTGTEVLTEEMECLATYSSTGKLNGSSTLLEGTLTTNITYDPDACTDKTDCSVETSVSLSLISSYESSCIDRDDFGDPAESKYILPWPVGKSYVISNSYCVPTGGHRQQLAYDFLIPIGDPIVASRAGVVRQVKEDSPDDGQGSDHNHVMIEHADGTVGFYAHLKQNGVFVNIGENVEAGQGIALAGYSGTTDVVHLHFGVYSSWPPVEGNDRAVNFKNMDGPVDCRGGLVNGATYTAQ